MKKLFVTGYIRSGTTFLANFLNAQKDCVVFQNFLGPIIDFSEFKIKSFNEKLTMEQKNKLVSKLKKEAESIRMDIFDDLKDNFTNLNELYDIVLDLICENTDCQIVGSKVTRQGGKVRKLLEETDMHIIYIYRDIRDVVMSAMKKYPGYKSIGLMLDIKKDYRSVENIKHERFLMINFEELIMNPDQGVAQLSKFLGVPIVKELKAAKAINDEWIENSSFGDIKDIFDKRSCFRWRNKLDSEVVKICEILSKDYIEKQNWLFSGLKYSFLQKFLVYFKFFFHRGHSFSTRILNGLKS